MKVLIADDSVLVRQRLAALIAEINGVELVGQADDACEALEAARQLVPDVVILDIRLPDRSGIEVLKVLKGGERPPLVIMLTAFPYPQFREECKAAGAEHFFDKSSEFDEVLDILQKAATNGASGASMPPVPAGPQAGGYPNGKRERPTA